MTGAVMRVLISVDMEGVAGVVDPADVRPGEPEYERNRELMTDEANAAIAGVVAHSADAEILVSDAHAVFRNLLPSKLDPAAKLLRGRPKAYGMMAGIDTPDHPVDAVMFVGYHGRAGRDMSVLSHTLSGASVAEVRLDGEPIGEVGMNASLAAHFGAVPVLAAGDETVAEEASAVAPGIRSVVVKRALGTTAAENLHPSEACRQITDGVTKALRHRDDVRTRTYGGAIEVEVEMLKPSMTEYAELVPGVSRVNGRTVRATVPDMAAAYRMVALLVHLT